MVITTFASGELSSNLNGRTDIPQYFQSASRLENFNVIPTGGIERRPGFKRLGKLAGNCRIIPFILDKNTSFVLEFRAFEVRIWRNGQKMVDDMGDDIIIKTKYSSLAECREIQYAQNFDTLVFCHRTYPPFMIKYDFSTGTFAYGDMSFNFRQDVSIDDDFGWILTPEEELPVAGMKDQYCLFQGILYRFSAETQSWVEDETSKAETDLFTTQDNYPGCVTFYNNRLWLGSTNRHPQRVWASRAPDTDDMRYNDFSTTNRYITTNRVIKDADLHLFSADIKVSNIAGGKTVFVDVSQDFTSGILSKPIEAYYVSGKGIPVGTKVLGVTKNTMTVGCKMEITADLRDQVMSIQLWKDRGTPTADDYEFQIADNSIVTSDCSFFFEIASTQNDAIRWIAANRQMVIGTESSLWYVPASVTALSIYAELNGRYGSDDIQGFPLGSAVIFFAQGRKAVRECYYDSEAEAFVTNNIAILAEHLLRESAAVDFDYMTNPYNRLFVTREDGTVATMLYDKPNGILAWSRISHGGGAITGIAVTRGEDEADLVYCSVKCEDGEYLEVLDETGDVYLDGWQTYTPPEIPPEEEPGQPEEETPAGPGTPEEETPAEPETPETGGETAEENTDAGIDTQSETGTEEEVSGGFTDGELGGYGEGAVIFNATKDETCPADAIPEDFVIEEGDELYIGYPYQSVMKSMPVVNQAKDSKKRITHLLVRFNGSWFPVMKCGEKPDEFFTGIEEPYSGVRQIIYPGTTDRDVFFSFTADKPRECRILTVSAALA